MRRPRPRIRTVLLAVNLAILLLPLAGIGGLRLYENELTRQTEATLLAQGAYVREDFLAGLVDAVKAARPDADARFWVGYGTNVSPTVSRAQVVTDEPFEPLFPELDLGKEPVRPPAAEAVATTQAPDPFAAAAGQRVGALLRLSQRYTLSGVRVVDHQGIVVATSRGELGLSLSGREEVRRALLGEDVRLLRERVSDEPLPPLEAISRGNRVRLFVALPVIHEGRVLGAVVLSRTPVELQKALYQNRAVLFPYGAALLALVVLVSLLTAVTISRPIGALIEQAERVKRGDAAQPLSHPGSREIEQLSQAVADMAQTLRARAAYIETFARNVSHEFKTPLATLRATVELLRDHLPTMTTEERARFLGMLDGEAARMQRLVDRLLLLARAEVAGAGTEEAEAGPVLEAVAGRFRELGLAVTVACDPLAAAARVRIPREALGSILSNILENSRQHGGGGVRVEVQAAVETDQRRLRLSVRDDGPGISDANRAKVFAPFFTTAREQGGTGLGLSIVKALVESHGGTIALGSGHSGRGLGIEATLPLASDFA